VGLGPIIYAVAKAGVIHLSRQAALELAPDRIRVNSICPGWVATPIFGGAGQSEEERSRMIAAVRGVGADLQPLPLAGTPEALAEAYLFLASDEARFVTGANFMIDGGLTISPAHAATAGSKVRQALDSLKGEAEP
jgi:NAD(P)-dependent dehydrogenase (short-subunit alcohol dehydrogenase family)